jgi:hypothetical protein
VIEAEVLHPIVAFGIRVVLAKIGEDEPRPVGVETNVVPGLHGGHVVFGEVGCCTSLVTVNRFHTELPDLCSSYSSGEPEALPFRSHDSRKIDTFGMQPWEQYPGTLYAAEQLDETIFAVEIPDWTCVKCKLHCSQMQIKWAKRYWIGTGDLAQNVCRYCSLTQEELVDAKDAEDEDFVCCASEVLCMRKNFHLQLLHPRKWTYRLTSYYARSGKRVSTTTTVPRSSNYMEQNWGYSNPVVVYGNLMTVSLESCIRYYDHVVVDHFEHWMFLFRLMHCHSFHRALEFQHGGFGSIFSYFLKANKDPLRVIADFLLDLLHEEYYTLWVTEEGTKEGCFLLKRLGAAAPHKKRRRETTLLTPETPYKKRKVEVSLDCDSDYEECFFNSEDF